MYRTIGITALILLAAVGCNDKKARIVTKEVTTETRQMPAPPEPAPQLPAQQQPTIQVTKTEEKTSAPKEVGAADQSQPKVIEKTTEKTIEKVREAVPQQAAPAPAGGTQATPPNSS